MCLRTVESTAKGRSSAVLTGYKLMYKCDRKDGGGWSNTVRFGYYLTGKWYKAKTNRKELVGVTSYELGFHVYPTMEDAKKDPNYKYSRLVRVHYKGILAKGTEYRTACPDGNTLVKHNERNVVVARYIKIVKGYKVEQ